MLVNLLNQILAGAPKQPLQKSQGPTALAPVNTQLPANAKKQQNPFMIALNTDSAEYRDAYGVNRPLQKPMFLGYHNDKALYGGGKLFILY